MFYVVVVYMYVVASQPRRPKLGGIVASQLGGGYLVASRMGYLLRCQSGGVGRRVPPWRPTLGGISGGIYIHFYFHIYRCINFIFSFFNLFFYVCGGVENIYFLGSKMGSKWGGQKPPENGVFSVPPKNRGFWVFWCFL